MSQPISVSVQMDAASFHDFAAFDLLRHHKAWHRPLVFTAILLVSAGVCLSQVGQKDGAALLTVLLAVVALGVPAVYFWTFFHSLRLQIKKMGLPRPFYRLLLDDDGLSVWMAGEQDKPEASRKYAWHDMHLAYRTPFADKAGLRPPASASCFKKHLRLAGRCPNSDSLFPPPAAVVAVAPIEGSLFGNGFAIQKQAAPWKGGESGAACV